MRDTLILYTTAICNLKCTYCYIDKNPALLKIDQILDESFKGDYYFNFSKKLFTDPTQLIEIQIWGGEPTLRLDRSFYTINKCIEYYPNLKHFMFSTNFIGENWFEQFEGFIDIFRKYPNRNFSLKLQLSIDGPPNLNDAQRGKGVTQKFVQSFQKLLTYNDKIPSNLHLHFFFKPTLSTFSIPLLQTKEDIIKYYTFFEDFYTLYSPYEKNNFEFTLSVPNTACPSPHTKADGIMFANLCKLCREIEKEGILQYYKDITPFSPDKKYYEYSCSNMKFCRGTCGMGIRNIGLLPNNKISLCHNGFVDLLTEYKINCEKNEQLLNHSIDNILFNKNSDVRNTNCSYEEFEKFESIVLSMENNETAQNAHMVALIIYLAKQGLIEEKYKDIKEAIKGAYFIFMNTAYCVRDNIGSTGSSICNSMGLIKLLLNGAREYIENE